MGQVSEVQGRRVFVAVDRDKNLSEVIFNGDVLTNVSVNSFVEIRKGFLSIIGRIEGERVEEVRPQQPPSGRQESVRVNRVLSIALTGYIDHYGAFRGGMKELPLIGNEAFVVPREKLLQIHNLVLDAGAPQVSIATVYGDHFDVTFPVDGLFNMHIAIFGNTGSGKSNTLAHLYQELFREMCARNADAFRDRCRFVIFDFNGEYAGDACITNEKTVYSLTTQNEDGDRLPLDESSLLDLEVVSILGDATERTQKPFIARAIELQRRTLESGNPAAYLRAIVRDHVEQTLRMGDRVNARLLIDLLKNVVPEHDENGDPVNLERGLDWHGTMHCWRLTLPGLQQYFNDFHAEPERTVIHQQVDRVEIETDLLSRLIMFLYVQLVDDILRNRAQNEHVAPLIGRLSRRRRDIAKVFDTSGETQIWQSNLIVINLDRVNLGMKKVLPLLVAKNLYEEHKADHVGKTLSIIIDEAHNILSTESSREAETWKDYRLETFEEIIKEGRKFGVFVTIASQRPNDISPTISSQAHNYFIHRLVNQHDLRTISTAVSYIDRATEEAIPTLATGTCVFSGVASQMPLLIDVKPLDQALRPHSETRTFATIVPSVIDELIG
ncbi:MAG: ATP-binding protein [Pseudomonadales bacterium]